MPYTDKECELCGALMEDVWATTKACDECTTNKCDQCGDQFEVKPRQKDRSYCSRKCATKSQQDKVQLECEYCGGQFEVQSYRKDTASYCSEECHNEDQRDKVELTCEGCGEQFETIPSEAQRGRKHCSAECAGIDEKEYVVVDCAQCGAQISVKPSRAERTTYCSRECKDKSMHDVTGTDHPRWKGGHEPYYGANWEKMRKLVRSRDDHTCMRCGRHEKQLPRQLDVHHIVPIREFDSPENANTMENLVALCWSCHGKVENTEGNGQNLLNHTTIQSSPIP